MESFEGFLNANVELTKEELKMLKSSCVNARVKMQRINPKSMTLNQFMGYFDSLSNDWADGILSKYMRIFSFDASSKRFITKHLK